MLCRFVFVPTSAGRVAVGFAADPTAGAFHGVAGVALAGHTDRATQRGLLAAMKRSVGATALEEVALEEAPGPLAALADLLVRFYEGADVPLAQTPLDLRRTTPFRQRTYAAARAIPRGETRTYGELAAAMGSPSSGRAVGQALAQNPFPLCVPCHRVVAQGGALRGFSAPGGTRTKARLLALERPQVPETSPSRQRTLFEDPPP